jgi:hypothetical protein
MEQGDPVAAVVVIAATQIPQTPHHQWSTAWDPCQSPGTASGLMLVSTFILHSSESGARRLPAAVSTHRPYPHNRSEKTGSDLAPAWRRAADAARRRRSCVNSTLRAGPRAGWPLGYGTGTMSGARGRLSAARLRERIGFAMSPTAAAATTTRSG